MNSTLDRIKTGLANDHITVEDGQTLLDLVERLTPESPSPMQEAHDLITGDRAASYGDATVEYTAIGMLWSGLLAHKLNGFLITADEALMMMAAMKMRRQVQKSKRDNIVDAHGYIALAGRVTGHGE